MARRGSTIDGTRWLLLALLVAGLGTGCASHWEGTRERPAARTASEPTARAQVWPDLQSAAVAALRAAREGARPADRGHLLVGSIVRVDGGYTWRPPRRSRFADRPIVRLEIDERHVATYVVHPIVGETAIDRANERVTRHERRLVDEADPLHRPIFVLTPSGRLLSYAHGEAVVEVVDLRRGRGATAERSRSSAFVARWPNMR